MTIVLYGYIILKLSTKNFVKTCNGKTVQPYKEKVVADLSRCLCHIVAQVQQVPAQNAKKFTNTKHHGRCTP